MELRGYREGDLGVLARLAAGALGESVGEWEEYYTPEKNPSLDPAGVYVVEEDGEARATAAVLPLEVFVDGRPVEMGGISAVATHPAYRRRGYAGKLMRTVLEHMRGRGVHLSMLDPFAHVFYRRYGWELATETLRYRLKPGDLPTSSEQGFVRAYVEEDFSRVVGLFEEEMSEHTLCVRRGEGRWRQVLGREDPQAAVYEKEGRVEGYLLYEQSDLIEDRDPQRTLTLSELVAGSPGAWEALISFAAAYDPLVYGIKYSTPRGKPLHPHLRNSYVEARISPEFMLRLVDVEGAIKLLNRNIGAPLVLAVEDDVIVENAGLYTVGNGEVVRGAEAAERVTLDVRQLAQLYAGYLPAPQIARHGLIEPGSPRALEMLDALFPPDDPWVAPQDHF